ncbi:helix-turn-helix domain-containing protein [Saccharomonospora sp.]|uniref:helix-turn-helix domain-containing protein n=1 Tax=Saccharomonospora sp. TaxID=33913 RepID=UPI00261EAFFE|nr:helix-turn-helix domain-containing protein [Saccharomonospora sp.]
MEIGYMRVSTGDQNPDAQRDALIRAGVAEFQRNLIVANTHEGLAAARARGRKGGRRPKITAYQAELAQQLYDARKKTVQEIADLFTVPRNTIYGYLNNSDQPSDV